MIVTLAGRVRRSIAARLSTPVESLRAAPAVEDSDLWAAAASCRGCSGPKVPLLPLNRDPHRLKIGYSVGRYGPEIGRRVLPDKK
jgi:hypothetical protein